MYIIYKRTQMENQEEEKKEEERKEEEEEEENILLFFFFNKFVEEEKKLICFMKEINFFHEGHPVRSCEIRLLPIACALNVNPTF